MLCLALNENPFFGAAAQGFPVFAQSPLVFHDTVDVLLPVFHFFFEVGDHGPLRGDFPERLGHFPRALFCEQGNLPVGERIAFECYAVPGQGRKLLAVEGVAHTNPIPLGVRIGRYLFSSRMLPYDPAKGWAADGAESQAEFLFANTDALLKTLLFTNVEKRIELHQFLARLHARYGLVFGDKEAEQVLSKDEFDKKAFQHNSRRLEQRLGSLGLLRRLSDGCAYVVNSYHAEAQ